jgi:hypothetical protein
MVIGGSTMVPMQRLKNRKQQRTVFRTDETKLSLKYPPAKQGSDSAQETDCEQVKFGLRLHSG